MKIAVFGANGKTGFEVVKQGLERGHQVTALVRNPPSLQQFASNPNFKAIKIDDIFNPTDLDVHIRGNDCVLSALGSRGVHVENRSFYLDSMKPIVAAMRKANIKRLICVTSFSLSFYSIPDANLPPYYLMVRNAMRRGFDSMNHMEQFLFKECQDLDFTIVRPPRLLDEPLSDVKEKSFPDVNFFLESPSPSQLPRANLARFMLGEMINNQFIRKGIAVAMPKEN